MSAADPQDQDVRVALLREARWAEVSINGKRLFCGDCGAELSSAWVNFLWSNHFVCFSCARLRQWPAVKSAGEERMSGAVQKARDIVANNEDAFMPSQFSNPDNPAMHRKTTAKEILKDTDGSVDAFVAGVGTGGTLTGAGEVLKKAISQLRVVAVEPKKSDVLSGGKPGLHMIQGIGAGFVPEVLNRSIIDEVIAVSDEDAYDMAMKLTRLEGIFAGISAGAACFAALKVARSMKPQQTVVVIFPDSGERYLSVAQYFSG